MTKPKPNSELTTIQMELLRQYRQHVEQNRGKTPTVRWLAEQLDVYPNTIQHHLGRLRVLGYLQEKKITAIRIKLSAKGRKVPL